MAEPVIAEAAWGRGASARESPFVGRTAELETILARLADGERLVSILGPPGMGKTRLARQAAKQLRAGGIGCAEIDAAACRDVESIRTQLILSLGGVADAPDRDARDGVLRTLAEAGPGVVLIDNVEAIVDVVAPELERWLEASASLQLLVTSRVRLRVPAEIVVELGPLEGEAAEVLFEDRARRAVAGFSLRADERPIVRELVARLDGLPLAIELAAARSRILRPADLLRRAHSRLELLETASRSASRGTLASAIASSFDALGSEAQAALRFLSVLAKSHDLETVEAIAAASAGLAEAGSGATAGAIIEELVDASLLRAVVDEEREEVRFCLYESIRDFAAMRLDRAGERERAERVAGDRLLICAERLAEAASSADAVEGLERLAGVREELHAACEREIDRRPDLAARLAMALHVLALARGPIDLHHVLVERVLAALRSPEQRALQARLEVACGYLCFLRGQLGSACDHLSKAYATATELGLNDVAGEAGSTLLLATQWKGQSADGEPDASGDLSSFALFTLGLRKLHHGDIPSAAELLLRAREVGVAAGHHRDAARALGLYGLTRHEIGRLDTASEIFDRAASELRRAGDRHFGAVVGLWRSLLAIDRGEIERSLSDLDRAIAELEDIGDPTFAASAHGYRALALLFAKRPVEARDAVERALPVLRAAEDTYRLGVCLAVYGATCAQMDDLSSARRAFDEGAEVARRAANPNVGVVRDLLQGFVDLRAGGRDAAEKVEARLARARRPVRTAAGVDLPPLAASSSDVRFATALLEREFREAFVAEPAPPSADETSLAVAGDGSSFRVEGRVVDLRRRQPLSRLLARLADEHAKAPGTALPTATLVVAGWPGERMIASAGANRVHVAIATLRKMGLGHRITRAEGGYLIPAEVRVTRTAG